MLVIVTIWLVFVAAPSFHVPKKTGRDDAAVLKDRYVVVHVNVGEKGISDNFDVAERYGVPLKKGVPALAVLDGDGKVVFAHRNGEFESMRKMDPQAVNDFLVKWSR